ncbi:hypothetical protein PVAND_012744 [Polypedilum vanderplanki]|uniref:Uncharacterized protein n=1 Tax=Polypedilum vanderplanki TaxID=319348 RepID=A0A9J6CMF2_POLVA|nr:hypothetical protein PVAND_012744 [Polypedilum vanderplanki]
MALSNYAIDYWDSIDIGLPELNHSQGFFRRTHSLHEKDVDFVTNRMKNLQTQQSVPVIKQSSKQQQLVPTKKPAATNINAPKQNLKQTNNSKDKENVRPVQHRQQQQSNNRAILAVSIVKNSDSVKTSSSKVATSLFAGAKKTGSIASSTNSLKGSAKEYNHKPPLTKSISQQKLVTNSKLFEYAEIQKKKKEELIKKLKAEEERELKFKFHAKPVPKFVKVAPSLETIALKQQYHKEMEKKKQLIKQKSLPNLPIVGKKEHAPFIPSCADPERLKHRAELKKKLIEKYKPENVQFKARNASVLQKPVFQPKHNFRALDAKPFKLTLTTRMIQRSTFDKQFQENQAIRERQKEIMQRQKDLEERKILRQNREFRATPYPVNHR